MLVDHEDHVAAVSKAVSGLGLRTFSLVEFIVQVKRNVRLISFGVSMAAVAALFIAALGIANTMVMSVLERTHEIGVMKAIGARDRDVLRLFLIEGALIGLRGGLVGLLVGWLAKFPGNMIARRFIEQAPGQAPVVAPSVFVFPVWLVVGIPLLTGLIATLAAIYPARRAARMSPIDSLRYE